MATGSPAPLRELKLEIEKTSTKTIVRGSGRITSATAGLLQSTIRGLIPETKHIVLDLTNVEFIDSSGLGALVSVHLSATKADCVLELANAKPRIGDLFRATKLSSVFNTLT